MNLKKIALALAATTSIAGAQTKWSAMTAETTFADGDWLMMLDATGPTNKKAPFSNLRDWWFASDDTMSLGTGTAATVVLTGNVSGTTDTTLTFGDGTAGFSHALTTGGAITAGGTLSSNGNDLTTSSGNLLVGDGELSLAGAILAANGADPNNGLTITPEGAGVVTIAGDLTVTGDIGVANTTTDSLLWNEKAANGTPGAGKGEVWVKSTTPSTLFYTDDANTDFQLATLAGTETLTNKTLVAPALGTPASGVATNLTGTAASLTAGTATAANGLKSATTTVAVDAATAPTSGQVLTATAGTTATWQTPTGGGFTMDSLQTSTPVMVEDFMNIVGHASIPTGALSLNIGGRSNVVTAGTANAPGWISLNAIGDSSYVFGQATAVEFGTGTFTFEGRFQTPSAASDGTDTYTLFIGFGDAPTTSAIADGAGLYYSSASANFQYRLSQGSTRTDTDSGLAFAASTVYRFRVVVGAASATFTIDGANSSGALSDNFPTGTKRTGFQIGIYGTLGASRLLNVDYAAFQATGLTR